MHTQDTEASSFYVETRTLHHPRRSLVVVTRACLAKSDYTLTTYTGFIRICRVCMPYVALQAIAAAYDVSKYWLPTKIALFRFPRSCTSPPLGTGIISRSSWSGPSKTVVQDRISSGGHVVAHLWCTLIRGDSSSRDYMHERRVLRNVCRDL